MHTFEVSTHLQVVSFLHHQAAQRLSHNPFEARDVVGVTSFLDLGLQVGPAVSAQHVLAAATQTHQ